MFNTLSYIGKKLNEENILWGVGASIVLNHYNLIDKPNDIDIFISLNNIERADEILKNMGEKKEWKKDETYATEFFYEYNINGFDIDIMSGFRVNHNSGVFKYTFDEKSIPQFKIINEVKIPLTSLEEWYVLYELIPGREKKVKLIEGYLLLNGVKNFALLERILKGDLPKGLKEKVKETLM